MATATRVLLRIGVVVALMALVSCESAIPAAPTFEVDVEPIFLAHCVRCHGAGGTLNQDPGALNGYATDRPSATHLDFYADRGDCTLDATGAVSPSCKHGAQYAATPLIPGEEATIQQYIHLTSSLRMPLAPAPALEDWELKVIDRWVATGAPD